MTIHLIRHGETELNVARVLQPPDTPLSPRGLGQAERLAQRLADAGLVRIFSSDLARARATAEKVGDASGAPLQFDPLLQERNFGELRGTAYADLDGDPFAPDFAPPGGETWECFHQRVDRAWRRIQAWAADAGGPIAVVSHGLVCHSIATRHLTLPERLAPPRSGAAPVRFGNTSVTLLRGPAPWRVERFACTAHLDAADAESRGAAPA